MDDSTDVNVLPRTRRYLSPTREVGILLTAALSLEDYVQFNISYVTVQLSLLIIVCIIMSLALNH